MKSKLLRSATFTVVSTLLACTGGGGDADTPAVDPPAEVGVAGGACYPNNTCNSGLACEAGTCVDPSAEAGNAGAACYPNDTCNDGLRCQSGVCVLAAETPDAGDSGSEAPDDDADTVDEPDSRQDRDTREDNDSDTRTEADAPVQPSDVMLGDGGTETVTLGPEGGVVPLPEGGALEIPEGALSEELTITVTATPDVVPAGYIQYSPVFRFEPAGLTFSSPAIVRIPVDDAPLGMSVYWSRRDQPGFQRLSTTVESGFAVARVSHFSEGFAGDEEDLPLEELPVDCLEVDVQGVSTYAPAAVRGAFVVRHCTGVPMVQQLTASNITILNDETGAPFNDSLEGGGASVPARLSDILDGGSAGGSVPTVGLFAVLSLDLSNSIVEAGATNDVIDAAQSFVDSLVRDAPSSYRYQVAIQVFGRTDATRLVRNFSSDYEALTSVLDGLRVSPGLGTTNLYGAYGAALTALDQRASTADIVDRTLVIVTDGRHEAGDFDNQRATALAARDRAAETGVDVYSVAVNAPAADLPFLEELATDASFFDVVAAADEIRAAFDRTAENLRRLPEATYVVGICSPVELGTAGLSVQVEYAGVRAVGSASYDASRLTGNVSACEPERVADPCGAAVCGPSYLSGFTCGTCNAAGASGCVDGECTCRPLWTGARCDVPVCSGGCRVDQRCVAPDHCACNDGFAGPTCSIAVAVGFDFSLVPAGTFMMGSPSGEVGGARLEDQHTVTLTRRFLLQTTEVTQAHWKALSEGVNPSFFDSCGDTCPVEQVDWYSALAFANALSVRERLSPCYTLQPSTCADSVSDWADGITSCTDATFVGLHCTGYRLPTESEWEYAARAGTTTATYLGNLGSWGSCTTSQPNIDPIAWWCGNSGDSTNPVRTRLPNSWGLFDMLGNVREWTWDYFSTYPGTVTDPLGPAASAIGRVLRGSDWNSLAPRAASRFADSPEGESHSGAGYGFRLARTLP